MTSQDKDKTEQALEKKSKAVEIEKAVTLDSMSFQAKNTFKNKGTYLPKPMSVTRLHNCDKTLSLKVALSNPDLHEELFDEIMGDLITGAYQNRLEAYLTSLSEDSKGDADAVGRLQKQRQSADMHLLNVIKAVRDIKRPPVQVIIKQADQVNVGDQQVNIAKNQQSA